MVNFNFSYDTNVSLEQRIGFEMAAAIWSSFLTDDIDVNLHIGATTGLDNGNAVGGAIPIFHEQTYGVFNEYYNNDVSSAADQQAEGSLQSGNTVDLSVNGELVNGNTQILLTSAQAKALEMDEAITLDNGSTWDRDLLNPNALDGYIVVNTSFDWNYDFARADEASEGTLDFLSMALHEIGHNLGFVSGLDGTIDFETLHSGRNQVSDFTALDLFRHTVDTAELENPDGSVSNVSIGGNAYFSIDGGATNLGDFSTGQNTEGGGDGYQASHWKRLQDAMGIMDPTLAYKERLSLSELDLQAMDVLGYDINYDVLDNGLDMSALLLQAEHAVATDLGLDSSLLTANRGDGNLYTMGYSQWWQIFEKQILEMGYSQWWQLFEMGYSQWWQSLEDEAAMLEMGYSQWWQAFEDQIIEMGYSQWWQEFETDMLNMGYSQWWQVFEMGYSQWWQKLETYFSTLDGVDSIGSGGDQDGSQIVVDHGDADQAVIVSGGEADDILAGSTFRDLVSGGGGDDLVDGKEGNDTLLGEDGNDILYGAAGDDKVYGGNGDDFIAGEDGHDQLYGEAGADILAGGFGNDLLDGGEGKDLLKGDAGKDVLDGGKGNDDVDGGEGNDIVIGGSGEDIVSGGRGDDTLYGDSYIPVTETDGAMSLEELAAQAGFASTVEQPLIDFWVRLEAEDFQLRNFNVEEQAIASGNSVIASGGRGEAKTKFSGPSGIYDIIVGYYDEKDGEGEIEIELGSGRDKQKFEWELDQDFGLETVGVKNFTTYTIRGVELEAGADIKIKGDADDAEFIRLDYVDIVSTTEGTAFDNAQFFNGSFYLENQTETHAEASALGGAYIKDEVKETAEAYWLKNTLGQAKKFTKVDVNSSRFNLVLDEASLSTNKAFRIEAEAFDLSGGYRIEDRNDFASGKAVIEVRGNSGQATTLFTGESGLYDIFVSYLDDGKKQASASFGINGQTLDQWSFDAIDEVAEYRAVGTQVSLNYGDTINLQGWKDSNEKAAIDYVEFVRSEEVDSSEGGEEEPVIQLETVRLEAENLWWGGDVKRKDAGYASGQELLEAEDYAYSSTTFTGESGVYNIELGYTSDKDDSQFAMWLGGNSIGSWNLQKHKDEVNTQRLTTEVFISNGQQLSFQTGEEKVKLDYIDFVPDQTVTSSSSGNQNTTPTGDEILIEAEDIWFSGSGSLENSNSASGGSYSSIDEANGSTLFEGETGYYDIVVSYFDDNDTGASLTLNVNEEQQDQWSTNQTGTNTFVERTVASGVKLTNSSDYLQLVGTTQNSSRADVDYIKLVKVEPPTESPEVVITEEGNSSDILRGGQGNDTIYGGEGNDILYGEDEFDTGHLAASNSSDVLVGGEGNDTLYGNSGNDILYGSDPSDAAPAESAATLTFEQGVDGYNSASDTILDSYYWNNYGELTSLYVDARNGYPIQSLLKFDNLFGDQAGQIELDDNITSATIELTVTDGGASFGVYEMLQGWSESSTWGSMNNGIQPNGYEAKSSAIVSTGWVNTGTVTIDVTESLQAWQADPTDNQGWAFITEGYDGVVLASTESGNGPRLVVETAPSAGPITDSVDNDQLFGGAGDDRLNGGIGDDRLEGTDAIAQGAFEYDILGGGLGADTFVLGNATQSYYLGDGNNDYARITDFDATTDVIQLHGAANSYRRWKYLGNLHLYQGEDLVSIVENTDALDFDSASVVFV